MTRAAVLFTGAVALALVARAAAGYRGADPLAFGLVLLIGVGLLVGLVELLVRATRAERLTREARALPSPATPEAIAGASPDLRAALEAKLAGSPAGVVAAPFTPYLLGLLVMIGLLGTFLGLFETLRGAREALTASADVSALRSGLAAPMLGLSRAFGTSAAGVSASAMLGLGSVFVRRSEARLVNVVNRYAVGPLAGLSVAARTLAALERIAAQSDALPETARGLEAATSGLVALEARLLRAQEESAAAAALSIEGAARAMREAADAIRAELGEALGRAPSAMSAAVSPILERAVAGAGEVAREELGKVTSRLEARAREDEARDGLLDALVGKLDATAAQLARAGASQGAELSAFAAAAEARAVQDQARAEERARQAEARAEARAREAEARAEERAQQDQARAEERAQQDQARAEERAQQDGERVRSAHTAQIAELLSAVERDRIAFATQLHGFIRALEQERVEDRERLQGFTRALEQARIEDRERLQGFTRGLEQARREDAERLEGFTRGLAEERAAFAEKLARFTREIEGARAEGAERLAEKLEAHARGVGESFDVTASLVRDASEQLRAGSAEMSAVAEMFTVAVDRYREASDRWLKNLGAIEDALGPRGSGEASDLFGAYLDQTREVFDHALQFQRELFSELRALRGGGAP